MCAHPSPKRVFIGGGGEGATLREVLRHPTVEECVMVDIDGDVVNYCRDHMPGHCAGVYKDPRAKLIIDDCKVQLEGYADGSFDVIIMDLSDPLDGGPCYQLYTTAFYTMCMAKLAPGGIFVTQSGCGSTLDADRCFTCVHNTLKQVFPKVWGYTAHVPSFTSEWSFNIAWKEPASQVRLSLVCRFERRGARLLSSRGALIIVQSSVPDGTHADCQPAGPNDHRHRGHRGCAHCGAQDRRQLEVV